MISISFSSRLRCSSRLSSISAGTPVWSFGTATGSKENFLSEESSAKRPFLELAARTRLPSPRGIIIALSPISSRNAAWSFESSRPRRKVRYESCSSSEKGIFIFEKAWTSFVVSRIRFFSSSSLVLRSLKLSITANSFSVRASSSAPGTVKFSFISDERSTPRNSAAIFSLSMICRIHVTAALSLVLSASGNCIDACLPRYSNTISISFLKTVSSINFILRGRIIHRPPAAWILPYCPCQEPNLRQNLSARLLQIV